MSDLEKYLADVKSRCEAASPGPWYLVDEGVGTGLSLSDMEGTDIYCHVPEGPKLNENVTFLQEAITDVPKLSVMVKFLIATVVELDQKHPGLVEIVEPFLEKTARGEEK